MNKLIKQALDSIGMQNFYITKGSQSVTGTYAVYTYTSTPGKYADNKKQGEFYTILVNLYCKSNIEQNKKNVIDALNSFGIRGGRAQAPFQEEEEGKTYFNTAISFNGYLEREDK